MLPSNDIPDAPAPLRRRGRAIAAAAGCAVAAAAITFGGTQLVGAVFTSQATVSGESVSTATIEIAADTAAGSAPIAMTDMLPGDTSSTTIALENTGSESLYYTIRLPEAADGDAGLEDALLVTVTVGSTTLAKTLSEWQDGALQLGDALAADGTQDVSVVVELPIGADDSLRDTAAGFSVRFDAIQARNTTPPTTGWVAD